MRTITPRLTSCPGCAAQLAHSPGPIHPYIGASASCWAVYGRVLSREFHEYRYPAVHRLTVDAYAAQHPGSPSRRSTQSVAGHLIALHAAFVREVPLRFITHEIRRALERRERFVWLDPPRDLGAITVVHVERAADLRQHNAIVRQWARSVWDAWSGHHAQIDQWARG